MKEFTKDLGKNPNANSSENLSENFNTNSSSNSTPNLNNPKAPKLAIIVPCYNEEAMIEISFHALSAKLAQLIADGLVSAESFLCFVDDGSKDRTFELLCEFKAKFDLSQNADSENLAKFDLSQNADSENLAKIDLSQNADSENLAKFDLSQNADSENLAKFAKNSTQNLNTKTQNSTQNLKNTKTHILKLSKNYGQQNALLAGLEFASQHADAIISIDADLQDDINAMDAMVEAFLSGVDIVYGARSARHTDSFFKKHSALCFYKIMHFMGVNLYNNAYYMLLSRRATKALLEFKEVNLFLRGIVQTLGFKSTIVKYDRLARTAGETKYSALKLFALAWEAITSFSIAPLRFLSVVGLLMFVLSIIYGGYALWMRLFNAQTLSGWTSTILIVLFFGGMQFLALGLIGEYIGKIYAEVKKRPRYFVDEIL